MSESEKLSEQLPGQNICGRKCLVISRVVGYLTDVEDWNVGKKEEFADRKTYDGNVAIAQAQQEEPGEQKP